MPINTKAPQFTGAKYVTRDTMFITSKTPIQINASDNDSGVSDIGYKINGGDGRKFKDLFYIDEEGYHKVDFYATDYVNNRNIGEFYFIIDNTGPEIQSIFSMAPVGKVTHDETGKSLQVYSAGMKIYLAETDKLVNTQEIYYTLNDQTEVVYGKPIVITKKGVNTESSRIGHAGQ